MTNIIELIKKFKDKVIAHYPELYIDFEYDSELDEYDTGYLLDLPMLSIEDMIEYLQQLNLPLKFVLNLKPNGKWYVENYYGFSEQEELCDCLWELTKKVLNK